MIEGGDGDDTISGDAGVDVILGGAGHDTLYAFNLSGVGDDSAVNYLYGDFGTNRDEAGSGRDRVNGGAGIDLLYGEGDDDLIVAPNILSIIDYGTGDGSTPSNFVIPSPTAPPALLQAPPAIVLESATLSTTVDDLGRWGELSGSASGLGIAGAGGVASSPAIASSATSQFAAWVDSRNGNLEIYAAEHTASGWRELAGSSSFGGVSNSLTASTSPSIAVVSGKPTIAWIETIVNVSNVRVAQFDATANSGQGAWVGSRQLVVRDRNVQHRKRGIPNHPRYQLRACGNLDHHRGGDKASLRKSLYR